MQAQALAQAPAQAPIPVTLSVDNFEAGVSGWTRNDSLKPGMGVATLSDILPAPGGAPASKNAALMTFKSGHKEWATLSRPVSGPEWARIGAQRITLWLNGGGDTPGVNLLLRGHYEKPSGTPWEISFSLPHPIRLDITHWRKVVIPLSDFRGGHGETLTGRLSGVYTLQFSQSGDWASRFFTVDDLAVEGTGIPLETAPPVAAAPSEPSTAPAPDAAANTLGSIAVSADFLKLQGRVRATGNVSIGASSNGPNAQPLTNSPAFRQAIGLLRPRFIRLDAPAFSDLVDSSRPAFDFGRLRTAVSQARALGAEPLVALHSPAEWAFDAHAFGVYCSECARSLNQRGRLPVRYFELCTRGDGGNPGAALTSYNMGYKALKALSHNFIVGGDGGLAGANTDQRGFLAGAAGLDFLSVSYYGATAGEPTDAALMEAARDVVPLRTVAHQLDASRFPRAALFVTGANLSNVVNPGDIVPSDARLGGMISGAWWAQYMASGSLLADQVFQNDAVNPEWGLLTSNTEAYPSYYALWLWNTYFTAGSRRASATSASPAVSATACNTPTAHNLLLVNTTDAAQTAQVSIRGFPVLREARMRIFDDPRSRVRFVPLPKSPFQTIVLAPYAVAVVQFLEPPRK